MLLAVLGALAIGLSLGLLGSGGSILTVPVLHYLLGQPEKVAIAGSLLVVGMIASAAAIPYARHRQVDWRNVAWFGLPGMAGAWLGATLAHFVPGTLQLALFASVMLAAGWRMLRGAGLERADHEPRRFAVVAGGLGVGILSGLVGVGGGFLIVPALVLLAGVRMSSAVGTSLAVIALNSYTGFAKYVSLLDSQGLELDFGVLFVVAALGVAGSFAGSRLGRRLPQAVLRRIFGVFLLAMASVIVIDVMPELLAGR
ncbi:MAG TPA: sulfite exporter TauE/SafE family protein [Steroidobacteraceae bacterium]|nr:sulfite exporter TauE/SafE family protein [Steroidobacteraceae bacterium]